MKVKKEQYEKNIIAHFYNRTVDKELLFRKKEDYIQFLITFKEKIFEKSFLELLDDTD